LPPFLRPENIATASSSNDNVAGVVESPEEDNSDTDSLPETPQGNGDMLGPGSESDLSDSSDEDDFSDGSVDMSPRYITFLAILFL